MAVVFPLAIVALIALFVLYKWFTAPLVPGAPRINFVKYQSNLRELMDIVREVATGAGKDKLVNLDTPIMSFVMATHPDVARDILKNDEDFPKGPPTPQLISKLIDKSLIFANGEEWRQQRSTISPSFQYDYLKGLLPIMVEKSAEMVQLLPNGEVFDAKKYMYHFTVDVLGLCAFGVDFKTMTEASTNEYYIAYETMMTHAKSAFRNKIPIFIREQLPLPSVNRAKSAAKVLVKMTQELAEKRKVEGNADRTYLIDMMLHAHPAMSNEQFETNTFLFFLAGHETTASALSWALYLLGQYPEIQAKVQAEVDTVLGGKHVNNETVRELTYLDMFIKEVLRYGSPISMILSRRTREAIQLDKYVIPKNADVGVGIHAIHHNPEFWPNPDVFDPERFSPDKATKQHPFAFLPFSLGRRSCIGNNFSLMEQKVFLSILLQSYTVKATKAVGAFYPDPDAIAYVPNEVKITLQKRKV